MGAGNWVIWTLAVVGVISLVRIIVDGVIGPRRRTGCGRCGYDVRNLRGWTCPECGVDLREEGVAGPGLARRLSTHPRTAIAAWTVLMALLAGVIFSTWVEPPLHVVSVARYRVVLAPASGSYPNLVLNARGTQSRSASYFVPSSVRISMADDGRAAPPPTLSIERETLLVSTWGADGRRVGDPEVLSASLFERWLGSIAPSNPLGSTERRSEAAVLSSLLQRVACGHLPDGQAVVSSAQFSTAQGYFAPEIAFNVVSSTSSVSPRPVVRLDDLGTIGTTLCLLALWLLGIVLLLRERGRAQPESIPASA